MSTRLPVKLMIAAPFVLAAVVLAIVLPSRFSATTALAQNTTALATPTVSVTRATPSDAPHEVTLPANVSAYIDTPIYARTTGYLKRWLVDIGTPVKAGQLLAEIETPEVDDSLAQTRATQVRAQADFDLAKTSADRWSELSKTDAVAQQEVDQRVGDARSKRATLDESRANVSRLQKLESFKRVFAPYDGVITARNTEVGALVNVGSGAPGTALFRLASTDRLRVFAEVPEAYAALAVVGQPATIDLKDGSGTTLNGKISRRAEAIDPMARTLHVEVDVDNPGRKLLSGGFAQMHFKFKPTRAGLSVPVNALLFRPSGTQVAIVDAAGKVDLKPIKLGRNDGKSVEVIAGLAGGESVVLNPADSIVAGQLVRVAPAAKGS